MESKLIKNKNFILLLTGSFVSRLGSVIYTTALSWWLTNYTGNSKMYGYIMSATTIALVLASPFSGVFADIKNKKNIMVGTDIISGVIGIMLSYFVYRGIILYPLFIVSSFSLGLCSAFFRPASKAMVPYVVNKKSLVKANSLFSNFSEISKVIGPGIASVLLLWNQSGASLAIFLNGISFLLSAFFEKSMTYQQENCEKILDNPLKKYLTNLVDGFRYVKNKKIIMRMLILSSVLNLFLSSYEVLLPMYVVQFVESDEKIYSSVLMCYSLGGIVVTAVISLMKDIAITLNKLYVSMLSIGIILMLLAVNRSAVGILMIGILFGITVSYYNTLFFAYIQNEIEGEYLGRTFSLVFTIAMLVSPVGYMLYGNVSNAWICFAFGVSGIISLVIIGIAYYTDMKRNQENMLSNRQYDDLIKGAEDEGTNQ